MIDLQVATQAEHLPTQQQFEQWLQLATKALEKPAEVTIRLVDDAESQQLNLEYRGKDKPTNVLSFPAEMDAFEAEFDIPELLAELGEDNYLGDLVISAPTVACEAAEQNKALMDHWAHLVIHGCLHLQGYDHIEDDDAEMMEALEIQLLAQLGIANPYS